MAIGVVRETIFDARAWVIFRDTDGEVVDPSLKGNYDVERMPARWANTRQPGHVLLMKPPRSTSFEEWKLRDPERLTDFQTIRPGTIEGKIGGVGDGVLNIAHQFVGTNEKYALNNTCYFTGWRPRDWRLKPQDYLIEVEVDGRNARARDVFRLCLSAQSAFDIRLREATKEEKDMVLARGDSDGARRLKAWVQQATSWMNGSPESSSAARR